MMIINPAEGKVFGQISEIYDKARVGYPINAIEDIIRFSKLKSGEYILDVGCGTGQLTIPFAEKGFNVTGVDISKEMINVAKKKSIPYNNCQFKVGSFESVNFSNRNYKLVVSGMAWHWITSKNRYQKLHKILNKDGAVALLWSYQKKELSKYVKDISKVLDKYDKVNRGPSGSLVKESIKSTYEELKGTKLFTSIKKRKYEVNIEFSKQRYLNLVISYGWVQVLPKEKINEMINEIQNLHKKYTDPIIIPYTYEAILAKK